MKKLLLILLATAAIGVPYAFGQCTGVFPNNTVCGNTTGSNAAPRAISTSGLVAGAPLTKTDDTNVTLTLGGSPTTALVNAASLTLGWTGQLSMARGGTAANLTPSNGGIVWTDANSMEVLAGTATAGQMLRSGASGAPSWSTATFPSTATSTGTILRANGTNWVASTATFPDTATGTGTFLRANGTNWVASTLTIPDTASTGQAPIASGSNTLSFTFTPTLGAAGGGTGKWNLAGTTSGTVTIQPQDAAGTYNFNLPTSAGSSGQALTSGGGGATAMSFAAINLAGGSNIVTGTLPVGNGGTGDTGTAWTLTNPTIVCGSGTLTSGSANLRRKTLGKTVFFNLQYIITTNGTCAGSLRISLPETPQVDNVFHGLNTTAGGAMIRCIAFASTAQIQCFDATGGYPGVSGQNLTYNGLYESQ